MGSKTFGAVTFKAYSNDHEPRHVHGFAGETEVVVDFLLSGDVKKAERKDSIKGVRKAITTDAEIEAAIAEPDSRPPEPKAVQAKYLPDYRLLLVKMDNGEAYSFFAPRMQGLQSMTPSQIARVKITGLGSALTWEDQDLDLHIPSLIEGIFGSKEWMAALGKKGGASRSLAKIQAARANGAKGGRPRRMRVSS